MNDVVTELFKSFLIEEGSIIQGFADNRRLENKYEKQLQYTNSITIPLSSIKSHNKLLKALPKISRSELKVCIYDAVSQLWEFTEFEIKLIGL